ncbi:MAG: hypothetical protein R3E89_14250 [Thiolinea sp.]
MVKSQPHGTIQPPLCTCKMLYTGQWFNDPLAGWLHGFRAVMLNGNPKWDEKNGANKMNPILASLYRETPTVRQSINLSNKTNFHWSNRAA